MISFLGAFPFLQDAPAVLGLEELVMAVTILTERYQRVLSKGATDRRKLLFKSLAVYDRKLSQIHDEKDQDKEQGTSSQAATESGTGIASHAPGFEIDQAGDDEPEDEEDDDAEEDEDDGLVLSTFELLDVADIYKVGGPQAIGAMIPADNFRKLVMLLLLLAPLGPQERLSQHPDRIVGEELESLRSAAESILAAFLNVEKSPGIRSRAFSNVLPVSLPFIFDGFNALFEHFLFSKNLDFNKHKEDDSRPPAVSLPIAPPLLQETGSMMSATVVSQLSFFIPGSSLFRRLRLLYSGDNDGFSMGSFETNVFNWRAPTILLVSGTRITDAPSGSGDRFAASLPPKRFPNGSAPEKRRLTFGLYLSQPWRHSHKECFGDADTLLFQMEPIHDVFHASKLNKDYVSFMKPGVSSSNTGISVGNPIPKGSSSYRRPSITHLGSVSLLLDSSFEFGVFTHDYTSRGGAFQNSVSRKFNFQDRFEIESLEVWGCGGDDEAKGQAERWAFEAREAEARRRINLGSGDIEADRALLEMAGLIGGNRSGGSMA